MEDLRAEAAAGAAEVDVWLRGGGTVVAASERAARALTAAFHRARRTEGLAAWPAPDLRDWHSFARTEWRERSRDDRLILSAMQEQALWAEIVAASGQGTALLEGPRQRMAALAMQGHGLLCAYAPRYLEPRARTSWQQDAGAFSGWLAEFDSACRSRHVLTAARLPLELIRLLEENQQARPPLLLAGFDRLMPVQRRLFEAWGEWTETQSGTLAEKITSYEAADAQEELTACALWCGRRLAENPGARLLVVTRDVAQRRGEIERAFLRHAGAAFEFSLGVPLSSVALARGAHLLLRWLSAPLEESEIDWLFSSGQGTAGDDERYVLTGFMRALRRRDRQRTQWELDTLLKQRAAVELPRGWKTRMLEARRKLLETDSRKLSPLAWAELVPALLDTAGWPGSRPLASAEFQALRRWQQVVDECASLGFDGRRMTWMEFLAALNRALNETLFAPESQDAPIQIAGPAESAGLTADAIWFLGASDDEWPPRGAMHPLLPVEVQRDAAMPHASPQLDWELAHATTTRFLASAQEAYFSYPRHAGEVSARASRLSTEFAGDPVPLPRELLACENAAPVRVLFKDASRVPLRADNAAGGSTVLTAQSVCPFKAFATARLGAQGWEPAQAGLTAAQRGQLLHKVLHAVWGGPPAGLGTHADLVNLGNGLKQFVAVHVSTVVADKAIAAVREQMPARYLELEGERLTRLVTEWLEFERTRVEFTVARTELDVTRSIAGLSLKLRIDRIDQLQDGSLLVVDYKTGDVSPGLWEMPRPEDVQLPLYAGFGVNEELRAQIANGSSEKRSSDNAAPLAGLVFAKVRTGNACFAGRVGDAKAKLLPALGAASSLVKKPFTAEELIAWRDYIEQMAHDFLGGHAEVAPRDYPKTCEHCDLQVICRVQDNRSGSVLAEESGDE